jgi:hypothetical protein
MAHQFLLSAASRTLSLRSIYKAGEVAATRRYFTAQYFAPALNLGDLGSVHKMATLGFRGQALCTDLHKITQLGNNHRPEA